MDLNYHGKDSNQHQDLIDFSVLTDAEVSPIVSVGNGSHIPMSTVAISTLPSFHSTIDVLSASVSQSHQQTLPIVPLLSTHNSIHLHQNLGQEPIMVQSHHHNSLSTQNHGHLQHVVQTTMSQGLQPQQAQPQMVELVQLAVDSEMQDTVQGHEMVTAREVAPTLPALEQCCICSANYEKPRRIFPQPDINRLLTKLLDINPAALRDSASFFSQYIPVCMECSKKVKKYARLRNEMEVIKQSVVSSLTDSFLYIQPKVVGSALECIKQPFLNRWVNRQPPQHQSLSNNNGQLHSVQLTNQIDRKKPARVLPTDHYVKHTSILQNTGNVNIFTADNAGNATDGQHIVTAYVADVMSTRNGNSETEDQEEMDLNPKTGMLVSKRKRRVKVPDPYKQKSRNGGVGLENGIDKLQRLSQSKRAKQHERPPYFCENCGRVFSILKSLRCHVSECSSELTKPVQCSICCAAFSESTWLDLKVHVDLAHADNCQLDKCRHCTIEFMPNTISDHVCIYESSGNAKAVKPHQEHKCDFCDKTYFHTNSLGNHVRRHHRGEETLTCGICSRTFTASAILKSHMSMHNTRPTGKRAHKCEECGIFCSTSWGLKQHKTIHSGERQYQCENCGKKFRLHQAWKAHEVVHTRERKYSCQICGKLFALYCTMQRHMKRHINPLPALPRGETCPICQDTRYFSKLMVLAQHMLRKHPGTKEQLDICSKVGSFSNLDTKMKSRRCKTAKRKRVSPQKRDGSNETDEESEGDSATGEYDEIIVKEEGDSDIEEILEIRSSRARDKASPTTKRTMMNKPASVRLKRNSL